MIKTFFDFCSGIGAGRLGLEQCGLKCVGYSDTSRLAATTYTLLHNTEGEKNYGNLKRINCETLPDFDLLIAGFPCQTFSVIGRQEGFLDDRGQIIFHLARIIEQKKPSCFLLENVKGLVTHDKGRTIKTILDLLESKGYCVSYRVLASLNYGVPQMRQRVYFIGFRKDLKLDYNLFKWPEEIKTPALEDYLIGDKLATDENIEIFSYYLKNPTNQGKYTIEDLKKMNGKVLDTRMNDLRIYTGKVPTLRAQRDGIYYVKDNKTYQLTGYEALLLQGFPKEYADKVKEKVSDRHLLMQAGNAMTVNVINALGQSIKDLFKKEDIKMERWEIFENECLNYLQANYENTNVTFHKIGGANSTLPDIKVLKNGKLAFYIEAKMNHAQSGQFVAFANETNRTFELSTKNKSKPNFLTDLIIQYMNTDFDRFKNAGTAGETIGADEDFLSDWIIDYYRKKNVKYFITKGTNGFIIFPINKFKEYFDVSATYRIKNSGSGEPAKKNMPKIVHLLTKNYNVHASIENKKLFVSGKNIDKMRFSIDQDNYYLSPKGNNICEVRLLSNTRNKNVIFEIKLKKNQDMDDLKIFESDLL